MKHTNLPRRLITLVFGVGLLVAGWKYATGDRPEVPSPKFTSYYTAQISPLIDSAELRQQQAAEHALTRLHEHFTVFRNGVPNFAEDITGWGTRFGIIGRSMDDLWTRFWEDKSKAVAVQDFTQRKFRDWIINEDSLRKALDDTFKTYREETEASRNRLEGDIKLIIGRPECPVNIPPMKIDAYLAATATASRPMVAKAGKDSVAMGVAGFAGGWIATDAVVGLTSSIITRLTAGAVATAAVSGSATVTGATAGGGGGSTVGPLGTIVGMGVGIAVGAIVDSWLNEKFKQRLSAQCVGFLDGLERDLVEGVNGQAGLQTLLKQSSRENTESYRKALYVELQKADLR
jgi:hypothetical protein